MSQSKQPDNIAIPTNLTPDSEYKVKLVEEKAPTVGTRAGQGILEAAKYGLAGGALGAFGLGLAGALAGYDLGEGVNEVMSSAIDPLKEAFPDGITPEQAKEVYADAYDKVVEAHHADIANGGDYDPKTLIDTSTPAGKIAVEALNNANLDQQALSSFLDEFPPEQVNQLIDQHGLAGFELPPGVELDGADNTISPEELDKLKVPPELVAALGGAAGASVGLAGGAVGGGLTGALKGGLWTDRIKSERELAKFNTDPALPTRA